MTLVLFKKAYQLNCDSNSYGLVRFITCILVSRFKMNTGAMVIYTSWTPAISKETINFSFIHSL